ncbi:uncharacterized protein LOC143516125 [Brachyhypopomus gauderio]|uniref:uncharacterized protein LOC143516125 n=1 Tax=Brachyhypopomus gauderio TaxID=698409 RepID=UPI004042135C
MCLQIPVHVSHRAHRYHHSHRNTRNLTYPQCSPQTPITVTGGLWNCQSAVQKADFISALASLHSLHFLALTETWITPENSATPAALSSAFSFTHSPRRLGRGGGTGLLLSPEWRFTQLSFSALSISSFEFHAITVSYSTILHIIVIYRPPGSLENFIDELDTLLSQFTIEANPLILLGDFNLPSNKLESSCILPLLSSFDLTINPSTATHRAGNILDLVFTRDTRTSDITVTLLHLSDHHLLSFSFPLPAISTHTSPVHSSYFHPSLRSINPSTLATTILSSLPHQNCLSSLSLDTITDTFLSTISSSINLLCPPSPRLKRSVPSTPWLTEVLRSHRRDLRTAERRWKRSRLDSDLCSYQSLLSKLNCMSVYGYLCFLANA